MTQEEFAAAYQRVLESFAVKTQVELSQLMGVRQSSISDAKRRCRIPDSWLLALVEKQSVNPRWILSGDGEKYLAACLPGNTAMETLKRASLQELIEAVLDRFLDKLSDEIVKKRNDN